MVARRWLWLVVILAALLGVGVGAGVVLRGRSLGPSPSASLASRPTFVVGPAVRPSPSPSPTTAPTYYVVQPGDTLRSIAAASYGAAEQWPQIYDANREVIGPDPDRLKSGMRLRLP
jgi:nucleoid-associated protein YgaU